MIWYVMLYNKVSDSMEEIFPIEEKEAIPDLPFLSCAINGELELFYVREYTNGELKWCQWHKKHKQWFFPDNLPEVVKLTRMLLE